MFAAATASRVPAPADQPVMLIVDVEPDWGGTRLHAVEEVLPRLVATLARAGAGATWFVVGRLAARIRGVIPAGQGFEVGSHGHTHARLDRLPVAEVRQELLASRLALEHAGYAVGGFRAPYLAVPPGLPALLRETGYRYHASAGALGPSLRNRAAGFRKGGVLHAPAGALRGGVLPCNLTWLRLLHPLGRLLLPRCPVAFTLHLHEFLPGPGGAPGLPWPLRRLHGRGTGAVAWRLLDRLLLSHGHRLRACRDVLGLDGAP